MYNMSNFIITQHAKERYAERIKDRDDKSDIMVFIAQNEETIQKDISKMIEYGKLIYNGPTFKDNQIVNVYINGLWVIILSNDNKTVVTLYPVDLGVDEELNKIFVEKVLSKITELDNSYNEIKQESLKLITDHQELIKNNEETIIENKKIIKCLEEQNESYRQYINAQNNRMKLAQIEIRNLITKLIGKNRLEV